MSTAATMRWEPRSSKRPSNEGPPQRPFLPWYASAARAGKALAAGEGGELGVLLEPGKLHLARRSVAVLADDDLGDALVVGVRIIIFISIQEHYHVCVLFDR